MILADIDMRVDWRFGLLIGVVVALVSGLYCVWLWDAERQVLRHTENLFQRIDDRNWSAVEQMIASDYADEWGEDRALVLERMRLVLGQSGQFQISAVDVDCKIDNGIGRWRGRILIESDDSEFISEVKQRVNSLTAPFQLEWRRASSKPWDWKLVRVNNPELEIPKEFQ